MTRAGGSGGRHAADAPVLRRTRLRLMAWSAGSTAVVLLVLGAAIYAAASSSLAASAIRQLEARAAELVPIAMTPVPVDDIALSVTSDPSRPGIVVGGSTSGTIGTVVVLPGAGSGVLGVTGVDAVPDGMTPAVASGAIPTGGFVPAGSAPDAIAGPALGWQPDAATLAALESGTQVMVETTLGAAPVRVLARPIATTRGTVTALVIGDRTAELETLRTLLTVLLGGSLAVIAAAAALGYVYAGRALVPIRDALRRQREFAADASHELRTPLAITRAAIAELRLGRDDPGAVDRALEDLDAGASRMEQLVADLLLLARADAEAVDLELRETDLALAAAEAAEALEPVAVMRDVRIVLDVVPAPVTGDEARLRQLATILIDNAVNHSPDGGRVTVAVAGRRLVVEDEGPGIDGGHLEHVFDRFWRAPGEPAGGSGLGLAIARWIVERHGGRIRAENRPDGRGARFVVELAGA
ncbi:MAG TPA: HAMP domain-containing sensor histidine kinase [Candidatus Limnocylindrales bacterium]|nr:HAMP domain-containing sensor histidine kinase [Candidatus Limnocylindrales bacterium]